MVDVPPRAVAAMVVDVLLPAVVGTVAAMAVHVPLPVAAAMVEVATAVDALRAVRKRRTLGETITISAADPLNLVGIVLPGPGVPALGANAVTYVDGVPEQAVRALA